MKPGKKIGFLIKVAFSVFLMFIIFKKIDVNQTVQVLKTTELPVLALGILGMVFDRFLMSYRWKLLLLAKEINARFCQIVRIYFLGSFIGNFLPSSVAPDAIRVYYAAKGGGQTSDIVSSVLVDRLMGILSLCMIVLVSVVLIFFDSREMDYRVLGLAVVMMAVIFIIFRSDRILDKVVTQKFFPVSDQNKIWAFLKNCYLSFQGYRNHRNVLFKALVLSFGVHALSILSVYVLSLAVNVQVSLFYFFLFVPLVVFLIMLPVSIGGIGIQEGAFVYFFTRVGVPPEHAFTVALLFRVLTMAVSLPGAYFYLVGQRFRLTDSPVPGQGRSK